MTKASYDIRNIERLSESLVRVTVRFHADGEPLTYVEPAKDEVDGYELIDINPYRGEEDLRRQLLDILQRKVAQKRAAEPIKIDLGTTEVELDA